jgi:AraC family transcriptional regulator
VPEGLVGFEIPAATYAVFPVRSRNRLGWGLAVNRAKKYAYESWLPRSPYRPAGSVDDFEYHDARCVRKPNLEIDLYVAVTKW